VPVCLSVRALQEKQLELLTPQLLRDILHGRHIFIVNLYDVQTDSGIENTKNMFC